MYCEGLTGTLAGQVVRFLVGCIHSEMDEGRASDQTVLAQARALANLVANYR